MQLESGTAADFGELLADPHDGPCYAALETVREQDKDLTAWLNCRAENQFSLSRAALSTRGAQKQIPISYLAAL